MSKDKRKYSSKIVDGLEQAPSRAMLRAVGFEDEDFKKLGIRRLPRNLLQAVDYLEKDKLAEKVLGKVMLNSYVNYKKDEWERYHQAVTDWEVKEYLRLY